MILPVNFFYEFSTHWSRNYTESFLAVAASEVAAQMGLGLVAAIVVHNRNRAHRLSKPVQLLTNVFYTVASLGILWRPKKKETGATCVQNPPSDDITGSVDSIILLSRCKWVPELRLRVFTPLPMVLESSFE